jgi:hypothetical protein
MKQVSYGYKLKISFNTDKESTISLTDGAGKPIPPPENAETVSKGNKVSFFIDTAELLQLKEGLGGELKW